MSELFNAQNRNTHFRRNLLTNASILALLGFVSSNASASSQEPEVPTVWIELGGQLERVDSPQTVFAPPFFALASSVNAQTLIDAQRPSRYAVGGEGKITFSPRGTDWTFSAGVRYGRSKDSRHLHHQTNLPSLIIYALPFIQPEHIIPSHAIFADAQSGVGETHAILDFQVGKDVGMGLFGVHGKAVVSAGIRFAQFTSDTSTSLHARPVYDLNVMTVPGKYRLPHPLRQNYTATLHANHDTHGVGPSFSWDASMPIAGNDSDATFAFDWGINAAVLFGRQRTIASHQTKGVYETGLTVGNVVHSYTHSAHPPPRNRSVTIPNVGGFAGLSLNFSNAKIKLGYRADFFFGAVDNGIDTQHLVNENFYGPFATISVGLGE